MPLSSGATVFRATGSWAHADVLSASTRMILVASFITNRMNRILVKKKVLDSIWVLSTHCGELTARLETRVQRHAAIHEETGAVDVVGVVGSQEHGHAANVLYLPDTLVRDELEQVVVGFGRLPGGAVDRGPDSPGADAIDPDAIRRDFLSNALHQEHD